MELRIALLRKGKSLRAFAREAGLLESTVRMVIHGHRSRGPAWEKTMRAAAPLLPAKMAAQIRPHLEAMDALRAQRLPSWAGFAMPPKKTKSQRRVR